MRRKRYETAMDIECVGGAGGGRGRGRSLERRIGKLRPDYASIKITDPKQFVGISEAVS